MNLAMRVTHSFIICELHCIILSRRKVFQQHLHASFQSLASSLNNCQHTTALDTLCAPQPGKEVLLSPFMIPPISIPSPPFLSMIQPLNLLGMLHYSFSFLPHPIQSRHLYFKYKSLSIFSAVIFTQVIVTHCLCCWRFSELDSMPPVLSPCIFVSQRFFKLINYITSLTGLKHIDE